jgi:hypothetical protein
VIRVHYSGPSGGEDVLSRKLKDAGFRVEVAPRVMWQDVGQTVVHVTLEVVSEAKSGLVGYAAIEAVKRVVGAFKARYPGVEAHTDDSDADTDDG